MSAKIQASLDKMTPERREARLHRMLHPPTQLERQVDRLLDDLTPREREVLQQRLPDWEVSKRLCGR